MKVTKLGSRQLHICSKVAKMGSIIGHRIDYNEVAKINPSTPRVKAFPVPLFHKPASVLIKHKYYKYYVFGRLYCALL